MNAKELYNYLATKYTNHFFASYEELNAEPSMLDSIPAANYPCVVVIPVSKQISFVADRFRIVETVVVASLSLMELDFSTEAIYDTVKSLEVDLMSKIYPIQKNILSYQVLSELNKFDANVAFAAFAIDIVNKPVCS